MSQEIVEYELTEEQNVAVELALTGCSLKVDAFAGTGKTTTLAAIGRGLNNKKGLYLAFNKSIADEAKGKFSRNVDCRTAHSLAYRVLGRKYRDRLGRVNGKVVAKELRLKEFNDISPNIIGYFVLDTVANFCNSHDDEITSKHLPWENLKTLDVDLDGVVDEIVRQSINLWIRMIDLNSNTLVTHGMYLKLWSLSKPIIDVDFILFDEAQDANAVMLDLVCDQNAQRIYVGDTYQQIYSWRGAVNAMENIETHKRCQITQSFRFGQPIANVANHILNDHLSADVNIRGYDRIDSSLSLLSDPNCIVSRTNVGLIDNLVTQLVKGKTVFVNGGCSEILALVEGAGDLKNGRKTNSIELSMFTSWAEVMEYSQTESGGDLKPLVSIIKKHGVSSLIRALKKVEFNKEHCADIVLTTAHKSKGREWATVKLHDDFRDPAASDYTLEESNVLYVAATRAKNILDPFSCDAIVSTG